MGKCLVIGLNPAWQKVLSFEQIKMGSVNRAFHSEECASGKGLNTARVLKKLGHECWVLQILGGENGAKLQNYCKENQITSLGFGVSQNTRQCLTLLENGKETELIEPFDLPADEIQKINEGLVSKLNNLPEMDALVFCGSVPKGLSENSFNRICEHVPQKHIFLDGFSGFNKSFLEKVDYLKINSEELQSMLNGFAVNRPQELFYDVLPKLKLLLVSRGKNPADVYWRSELTSIEKFSVEIPEVDSLNAIGAGDSTHAGLVDAVLNAKSAQEACIHALSIGTTSCLEILPAHFSTEKLRNIQPQFNVIN